MLTKKMSDNRFLKMTDSATLTAQAATIRQITKNINKKPTMNFDASPNLMNYVKLIPCCDCCNNHNKKIS